jgi:plastocyanin
MKIPLLYLVLCPVLLLCGSVRAQQVMVTARVTVNNADKSSRDSKAANVVLWLTSSDDSNLPLPASFTQQRPRLVQLNKSFQPHILIVPVGSVVEFPNHDPFFHNVFSLFEGKRFDLGLYEAGTTRDVRFDKVGISYIFCNIHPQMSAVVLALGTPFYGISDARGEVVIPNVPIGHYMLHIWYEAALPETLKTLTREVNISANNSTLGVLRLMADDVPQTHKNKYGRDYDNPTPAQNPAYDQQ